MATKNYHLVTKFPTVNANIDPPTHAFDWQGDDAGSTVAQLINDVVNFWILTPTGKVASPSAHLHPAVDRSTAQASVTVYDVTAHLDGSSHGAPIGLGVFTASAVSNINPVPPQIHAVGEYNASLAGVSEFGPHTRPRARRRGRLFLGPLNADAITNSSSTPYNSVVSAGTTGILLGAFEALLASTHFGPGWCVWSRVDAAMRPVIGGWIDSTPHVQRRTQDPSGVKTLWP